MSKIEWLGLVSGIVVAAVILGFVAFAERAASTAPIVAADGVETENPAVTVYYDTDFDVICWLYQPTTSAAGISCLSVTDLNLLSDGRRTLPK